MGCMVNVGLYVNVGDSLEAQLVKNPHAIHETPVPFLGWEVPLRQ